MEALQIAKYFLFLARRENAGDTFSNLKIQKMLYYTQGYFLLFLKKPCFNEKIEAWDHGPVVREVYNKFKKYGSNSISFNELKNFNTDFLSNEKEALDILFFIFRKYGGLGAWELRDKAHNEEPYIKSYEPQLNNEIPIDLIEDFFKKKIKNEVLKLQQKKKHDEDLKKYGFVEF